MSGPETEHFPAPSRGFSGEVGPVTEFTPAELLDSSVIHPADWADLPEAVREQVERSGAARERLRLLVEHGLLTEYQAGRVAAGARAGLVLGNYRLLDRIGAGGMGVVFRAEHRLMRRPVALKILAVLDDREGRLLRRFFGDMQAVARLQHPNIAAALDAGEADGLDHGSGRVYYLVTEFVPGQDLEELVRSKGPLPVAKACQLVHQVADALAEAHRRDLVHRDVRPSNVRVTPDGQAKLLGFGPARRMTQPATALGAPEYMAPEQTEDATAVDARADVYGLGGTLFLCLTGRPPFASDGNLIQTLLGRPDRPPPSATQLRPEVTPALDAVIARMMAADPGERYPTAQAVMRALLPFIDPGSTAGGPADPGSRPATARPVAAPGDRRSYRILIADDEPLIRQSCRFALELDGMACDEAGDGLRALEAVRATAYDLVLLDIDMPALNGAEVCRRLRTDTAYSHLKVVMMSGRATADEMARLLAAGADDYLTKPLSVVQLQARVKAALRLRDTQERLDRANRHLLVVNAEMERNLTARDGDLIGARDALVLALATLAGYRDSETGAHLMRLQRYARVLAQEAAPAFAGQIAPEFVEMVAAAAPLHDIGKVGLPDHVLLKPGRLDPAERLVMETHTVIGHRTLREVADRHGFALTLLHMAADIARHHHERYDGTGYPDGLAGGDIPLAARLVAVCDVYDALRSRRPYKSAFTHAAALQIMLEQSPGHFDPAVLEAFRRSGQRFEQMYRQSSD